MNNEEKILSMLEGLTNTVSTLVTKVDSLEQGQAKLEQGQAELKRDVTQIKVTLENETNRNIRLLVEGHQGVVEQLTDLKGLNEKVFELHGDTTVHKAAIKELARRTANL